MSETDISIPKEALEAAYNARRNGDTLEDICLAMLKAWPGVTYAIYGGGGEYNECPPTAAQNIILPLPQKELEA